MAARFLENAELNFAAQGITQPDAAASHSAIALPGETKKETAG
jgi:hypothetical protein